jgi:hypothetical protein
MDVYRPRPDWVRRLNALGPATGSPKSIVPLDPSELLTLVRETTGLAGHEKTIHRYLRDKPKRKFGRHEYALEEYGLDEAQIRDTYAGYVSHYGIESEGIENETG